MRRFISTITILRNLQRCSRLKFCVGQRWLIMVWPINGKCKSSLKSRLIKTWEHFPCMCRLQLSCTKPPVKGNISSVILFLLLLYNFSIFYTYIDFLFFFFFLFCNQLLTNNQRICQLFLLNFRLTDN